MTPDLFAPLAQAAPPAPAEPSAPAERPAVSALPAPSAALWRASEWATPLAAAWPTGHEALDAELPGGGWPGHALTEILQPQAATLEWRLLGPALRAVAAAGRSVVLVGPPQPPHLPGLQAQGLSERALVWVHAETAAERLWAAEQLIRANAAGALLLWLPQARPEQLRRLQLSAQASEGLAFVCRPLAARHEASAAPLRVQARLGADWALDLQILKRRGPVHEGVLSLQALPGGLSRLLLPRLAQPSRLMVQRDAADVVGRSFAPRVRSRSSIAAFSPVH
jgi:protein ImuA